jgi:flagellar motor protein MotB
MRRIERANGKTPRQAKGQHDGTWFVSYGDMITLLLGFFILFFSLEPPKKANTLLAESLIKEFRSLEQAKGKFAGVSAVKSDKTEAAGSGDGLSMQAKDAPLTDTPSVERKANMSGPAGDLATAGQNAEGADRGEGASRKDDKKIDMTGAESPASEADSIVQKGKELLMAVAGIQRDVKQPAGAGNEQATGQAKQGQDGLSQIELPALEAELVKVDDKLVIQFPNISFFNSASTDLTRKGRSVLETFSRTYLPYAGKTVLNIIGFADKRPVRSMYRFRDNLELSVLRAVSAQRVIEKAGIPIARTRLMGHGVKDRLAKGEMARSERDRLALSRKIMLIIEPQRGSQ